jgi:hypothetical protein
VRPEPAHCYADGLRRSFGPGWHLSDGQQRNDALRRPAGFVLRTVDELT